MVKNGTPHALYSLTEVVKAINENRVQISNFLSREKNKETLRELGLDVRDAVRHIKALRSTQFEETSYETGKPPADIYKKTISGVPVYIKFYLEDNLVVISFHKDEPPRRKK